MCTVGRLPIYKLIIKIRVILHVKGQPMAFVFKFSINIYLISCYVTSSLEKTKVRLTQPSLAGAWAELVSLIHHYSLTYKMHQKQSVKSITFSLFETQQIETEFTLCGRLFNKHLIL